MDFSNDWIKSFCCSRNSRIDPNQTNLNLGIIGRQHNHRKRGWSMDKPNLLLIMTDQQRWDAMGCSGGWVETPHMDRIAAEGVRFSNCVTNSPVCIPARLSLATGLYPHNTGVWHNMGHTLSPHAGTWMQAVRDAGYRTSLFGKTHLHPHGGDLRDSEQLMHA